MDSILKLTPLIREGMQCANGTSKSERHFLDFVVDGESLWEALAQVSYLWLGFYHKRKRKGPSVAGCEAPAPRGRVYILTGQKTVQLESPENLFLLRIEAREGALRAGPASRTKLFAALRGIVVRDFLDPFELLHHFFFQAEDGIRDYKVTGVQTCALPI